MQDVPAQSPDQELVLLLEGQEEASCWGPLLFFLCVWDNSAGTETQTKE